MTRDEASIRRQTDAIRETRDIAIERGNQLQQVIRNSLAYNHEAYLIFTRNAEALQQSSFDQINHLASQFIQVAELKAKLPMKLATA